MSEIDAIKAVADALAPLDEDERSRVLAWAESKYGLTKGVTEQKAPNASGDQTSSSQTKSNAPSKPKSKSSKKAKTIISMDKSLDLSPDGKQSAVEFAALKAPTNVKEKCIVAVYYLRDVIDLSKITVRAVFTFFKTVQWPVPTDLRNTLQQAGTSGWLDTSDSEDIKLTSLGENQVEHSLPAKSKTKAKV